MFGVTETNKQTFGYYTAFVRALFEVFQVNVEAAGSYCYIIL